MHGHILKRHTKSVSVAVWANFSFQVSSRGSVRLGLERMVPSQSQKDQEELVTRACFNAIIKSFGGRFATLLQQLVDNNVPSFGALVEL